MRGLAKAVWTIFAVIGVFATMQELGGQEKAPLAGATLSHIGVVVKDLDASVKAFEEAFGIPVTDRNTELRTPPYPPQFTGNRNASVRQNGVWLGSLNVHLVQPVGGPGPHYDHLERCGPSLQHIAFHVDDAQRARRGLEAMGGKWVLGHETYRGAYVYMEQLGMMVELQTRQPAAK